MTNFYWPVYLNLESEVVELSNKIHFDDNQLKVYSVKIAELLIRSTVEIEAISKDLYYSFGGTTPSGRDLYFDTDCIEYLDNLWKLSSKKVIVSSSNFYFTEDDNKMLTPLKKAKRRGASGSDWKRAYQAVKHNRTQNLSHGNLKNLLRAMAALFLLNIYYRDHTYDLKDKNSDNFTGELSKMFNLKVHTWRGDGGTSNSYVKHTDFEECTYLVKWTDDSQKKWREWIGEQNKISNDMIFAHPKVRNFIMENLIEDGKIKDDDLADFLLNRKYFELIDMKVEYPSILLKAQVQATEKMKFDYKSHSKYEAVLNRNQIIYS